MGSEAQPRGHLLPRPLLPAVIKVATVLSAVWATSEVELVSYFPCKNILFPQGSLFDTSLLRIMITVCGR